MEFTKIGSAYSSDGMGYSQEGEGKWLESGSAVMLKLWWCVLSDGGEQKRMTQSCEPVNGS